MKKLFAILLTLAMVLSLAACGGNDSGNSGDSGNAGGDSQQQEPAATPADEGEDQGGEAADIRVAMITDYGDITDQSFNQTTYEASKSWCEANGVKFTYYKPAGDSTAERVAMVERPPTRTTMSSSCPASPLARLSPR